MEQPLAYRTSKNVEVSLTNVSEVPSLPTITEDENSSATSDHNLLAAQVRLTFDSNDSLKKQGSPFILPVDSSENSSAATNSDSFEEVEEEVEEEIEAEEEIDVEEDIEVEEVDWNEEEGFNEGEDWHGEEYEDEEDEIYKETREIKIMLEEGINEAIYKTEMVENVIDVVETKDQYEEKIDEATTIKENSIIKSKEKGREDLIEDIKIKDKKYDDQKEKSRKKTIKVIKKVKKRVKKSKSEIKLERISITDSGPKETYGSILEGEVEEASKKESNIPILVLDGSETTDSFHDIFQSGYEKAYELVRSKVTEVQKLRRKNNVLHKTLIEYYHRKKMKDFFQTETASEEFVNRYKKKLLLLESIKQSSENEKLKKETELAEMKEKLKIMDDEYKTKLDDFLNREMEIGKTLIDLKTGKIVDEDFVIPYVQRQKEFLDQLCDARLRMIKFQKHLSSKMNGLRELISYGDFNVIEFEKLKMDNAVYQEKNEEREDEFTHLRKKLLHVIYEYSYVLEKSSNTLQEIQEGQSKLEISLFIVNVLREKANKLNARRNRLRNDTRKIKNDSGLLLHPKLILDYQNSIAALNEGTVKLQKIIDSTSKKRKTILGIQRCIKDTSSMIDVCKVKL